MKDLATRGLAVAFAITASAGMAPTARAMTPASPAQQCATIAKMDFSGIQEAQTQIFKTALVEAKAEVPAYCAINGTITPNVGFEIRLPVTGWNGRFFQSGCGNYCGTTYYLKYCDDPLKRGYACIVGDSGHVARPEDVHWTDGRWADSNLAAELDWGGRASHVTAVAGKAITEAFYGQRPEKSYFMGCSYGGHQAMVLAQRFPWDFDGIVGGGAPNSISGLMQQNVWSLTNGWDANMQSRFSEADIAVLHGAVLAKCDMDDGVKDRLVSNPRACKTDVDALVCKPSSGSQNCLSPETAALAKKMYAGPSDSADKPVSPGGWEPGTELFWRKVYRQDGTGLAALADNYFRYMGRFPDAGPHWSVRDYDFDRDPKRNDVMETLYAAANPDLRRFKANGGKFINYVGWHDLGTIPATAIDYYETVTRTMGGVDRTTDFFRMFMIPGALHCRGGEGPDKVDFLTYIEDWVERGKAPDMMVGARVDESGATRFTRPLYPYPKHPMYKGAGDPNDAGNFEPVTPR